MNINVPFKKLILLLALTALSTAEEKGGSASHMSMLEVSSRPQPGDFRGARFPATEVTHLNQLLAKGVVSNDADTTGEQKEPASPWYSYTLRGNFTYADKPYRVIRIVALRERSGPPFDPRHIVMLDSGPQQAGQAGGEVVYTKNPGLVAYVEGDFLRKLVEWNPDLKQNPLFTTIPRALGRHAEDSGVKAVVTHKESQTGPLTVTSYYRGDSIVLKKVAPEDESLNTVYSIMHNGFEVLTYKSGPAGTEFAGAGVIRDLVKPDYTIKMAGDKQGRIKRITLYSPDFKKTYDGFWLKDNEVMPWSTGQLEGWRKLRDSETQEQK